MFLEKIAEETAINGYAWHHTSLPSLKSLTSKGSGYEHCQMVNGQFVWIHESTGGIQELETHLCTCKDAERQIICITDRIFKPHTQSYMCTLDMYWHFAASLMENVINLTHLWSYPYW